MQVYIELALYSHVQVSYYFMNVTIKEISHSSINDRPQLSHSYRQKSPRIFYNSISRHIDFYKDIKPTSNHVVELSTFPIGMSLSKYNLNCSSHPLISQFLPIESACRVSTVLEQVAIDGSCYNGFKPVPLDEFNIQPLENHFVSYFPRLSTDFIKHNVITVGNPSLIFGK